MAQSKWHDIPSFVSSLSCSLRVLKETDLTITTFRPGIERDLETLDLTSFCTKLTTINFPQKKLQYPNKTKHNLMQLWWVSNVIERLKTSLNQQVIILVSSTSLKISHMISFIFHLLVESRDIYIYLVSLITY